MAPKLRVLLLIILVKAACIFNPAQCIYAQAAKAPVYVYASGGGGAGNVNHFYGELHVLFLRRHSISLGYGAFMRKSPATPDDYDNSNFLGAGWYPQEYLNGATLTYSYLFYPKGNAQNVLRYPVGAGLVMGTYSEPGNFHRTGSWFGPNYAYDDLAGSIVALLIKGGGEYTPTRAFGLCFGGYAVLGKLNGIGVYGGLMLGHVSSRTRIKNRTYRHR